MGGAKQVGLASGHEGNGSVPQERIPWALVRLSLSDAVDLSRRNRKKLKLQLTLFYN